MASEATISQVKEIQKGSAEGHKEWSLWCDARGNGVRDPSKHSLEFLDEFIAHYNGGGRLEVNKSPEKVEVLAELIKNGQRNSHHWQQAWSLYCQRYGRGVNDPYKHESSFLLGFLDMLAHHACMAMYSPMEASYAWPWPETGSNSYESYDPVKDACVQKIKALQRSSEDAKKQWWNFCDSQQGGVRDPTRHTVRVLQEFLSGLG